MLRGAGMETLRSFSLVDSGEICIFASGIDMYYYWNVKTMEAWCL